MFDELGFVDDTAEPHAVDVGGRRRFGAAPFGLVQEAYVLRIDPSSNKLLRDASFPNRTGAVEHDDRSGTGENPQSGFEALGGDSVVRR